MGVNPDDTGGGIKREQLPLKKEPSSTLLICSYISVCL